jgi:hypothetical protein
MWFLDRNWECHGRAADQVVLRIKHKKSLSNIYNCTIIGPWIVWPFRFICNVILVLHTLCTSYVIQCTSYVYV